MFPICRRSPQSRSSSTPWVAPEDSAHCGDTDLDAASWDRKPGWPFLGQFIAHDITADRSELQSHVDAARLRNARSPQLNLECLYGDGPVGHPFLYQRNDSAKLLTGPGGDDLLRNAEGTAIVGDPRNDSHVFMSQMHLAFLHAHNAFVDRARAAGTPDANVFETAARELRWHYQTVVLREFLPLLIGAEMTESLLRGDRRFYRPDGPAFMPLELVERPIATGIHRFGTPTRSETAATPFRSSNLLGFRPVTPERRSVGRSCSTPPATSPAQRAKKIDGRPVRGLTSSPSP